MLQANFWWPESWKTQRSSKNIKDIKVDLPLRVVFSTGSQAMPASPWFVHRSIWSTKAAPQTPAEAASSFLSGIRNWFFIFENFKFHLVSNWPSCRQCLAASFKRQRKNNALSTWNQLRDQLQLESGGNEKPLKLACGPEQGGRMLIVQLCCAVPCC